MVLEANIKSYLNERHIKVPDEWISACLQWIQSENPGLNVNSTRLITEKVFEQWLHADLTELASCCLPFGLQQKKSITLNGHFVLQVNQVRDVGLPAYTQLQKLRKVDAGNASVNADQQHQPSWEPKPTRMIMMQMTDGTSMVQGMEYRSIPQLNVNLKPGTKVLVSGSFMCRRGVLLLTREHITIMGGETEQLLVTNALENILARALGVEETEEPNMLQETPATQIPPSQQSQYYPSQLNNVPPRPQNTSQMARGGRGGGNLSIPSTSGGLRDNRPSSSIGIRNQPLTSLDELGDDDDFLDPDLEAALEQIESQAESSISNSNSTFNGSQSTSVNCGRGTANSWMNRNNTSVTTANVSKQNSEYEMDISDDFFNDDFDDEIFLSVEASPEQSSFPLSVQQKSNMSVASNRSSSSFNPDKPSYQPPKASSSSMPPKQSSNFNKPNNINQAKLSGFAASKRPNMGTPSKNTKATGKQPTLTSFLKPSSSPGNKPTSTSVNSLSRPSLSTNTSDVFKVPASPVTTRPSSFASQATPSTWRNDQQSKTVMSKDFNPESLRQQPFTYLVFLPEKPRIQQEFIIKGFIMTLTSKLSHADGIWKLSVIINDGSSSCEVDIDNKILCELIGFSVEEFNIKKMEAKINPVLRAQIAKTVSGCQQKLISLCSLLRLELSPSYPRPRLTEIIPVSASIARQLSQRCSTLL